MQIKKIFYALSLLTIMLLPLTNNVYGANFRIADKDNGNIYVKQEEGIKNLYTVGNMISIDTLIEKNLYVAGNVVTINGEVGGTIFSGAATLIINSVVKGSIHGGGGSIMINNKVADDLFVGGGNIVISESASIGDDLFVGGGNIDIQGKVSGDAFIGGDIVIINGEIDGNVKINLANKIKIGSQAKINGNLEYNSKSEIEIDSGAVILGKTTILDKKNLLDTDSGKRTLMSIILVLISLSILVKVGGLIIVGLILLYLFKNITEKTIKESLTNFWKNLLISLIVLIITPVIIVFLMISLVGIWLGIILGLVYMLSILLAISLTSLTFGSWLIKVIKKRNTYHFNWKVIVGGVIVLTLIELIPVIGTLIFAVFMLISLGGIYSTTYKLRKSH